MAAQKHEIPIDATTSTAQYLQFSKIQDTLKSMSEDKVKIKNPQCIFVAEMGLILLSELFFSQSCLHVQISPC